MKLVKLSLISLMGLGLVWSLGCGGSAPPEDPAAKVEPVPEPEPAPAPEPEPEPEVAVEPEPEPKPAPVAKAKPAAPAGPPVVVMETNKGTIKMELAPDRSPKTVANFLKYVDDGFYDGLVFHRIIPGFMIQGGGFTPDMKEKANNEPIENEAKTSGLANVRGSIAMARTGNPHSATSQFFINHATNRGLDPDMERSGWGYAVFGKVTEGMDVVDSIAAVQTGNRGPYANVPVEAVIIKSASRAK